MADRLPANDEQRALLWRSAELLERAGDVAATEAVLERIAREHAGAFAEALEARQQLIELAEARNDAALVLQRAEALIVFETSGSRTP
ncbi:hypothetical protein RZS08_48680, partial [Arthrospira platensis SPKY1]|nr:hypothetical protein [Arthrospira platensis SPKY1]